MTEIPLFSYDGTVKNMSDERWRIENPSGVASKVGEKAQEKGIRQTRTKVEWTCQRYRREIVNKRVCCMTKVPKARAKMKPSNEWNMIGGENADAEADNGGVGIWSENAM